MAHRFALLLTFAALAAPAARAEEVEANACAACHEKLQPGIVSDWRLSKHSRVLVGCQDCHGVAHQSSDDAAGAVLPTIDTCQRCHELQAAQFRRGKHARAWAAVKALPTFHLHGKAGATDPSGCVTCHRIGVKTEADAAALRAAGTAHGLTGCDACHTRHLFSAAEARQPEACRTCHGDLQYAAWASSKHGTRHALAKDGRIPADAAAPSCQVCHMQNTDHSNRTPWGNLGLRLPLQEDPAWARDQQTLLVAIGVLGEAGSPGARAKEAEASALVQLDRIDFQAERHKLTQACRQCHAVSFVQEQLDRRDGLVRRIDALTASAVREVAALYEEGVLVKKGPGPFPDLVQASAGEPIEQTLAGMFFDHRLHLLANAFHMTHEIASSVAGMERDLASVQQQAEELRHPTKARKAVPKK